jgi:glycosyltransferase involved in cell wall biosynthesis
LKKVLINTSNLQKGGALQTALSFINMANNINNYVFHIILGRATSDLIDVKKYPTLTFSHLNIHPSDSFFSFFTFRKELTRIESSFSPDGVISIFGPIYWKPKTPHIMGFANGYYLYEDSPFFNEWKGHKTLKYGLKKLVQKLFLKSEAKLFWIETEDAKIRFSKFLKISTDAIIVASNCANENFVLNKKYEIAKIQKPENFSLLFISGFYIHKNHKFIVEVDNVLKKNGIVVNFYVTLEDKDFIELKMNSVSNIINLGFVSPDSCPAIYKKVNAVFMPSLLETFSAVYPEAMISKKPIVTSNLSFAKNLCGDAALFYDYNSATDAANKIIKLINDRNLYEKLVHKGLEQLKNFDSPKERFNKVLNKLFNNI